MSKLVNPHGAEKTLKPLQPEGEELNAEQKRAATLRKIPITSREVGDTIMMGIGGFTPLDGFMGEADWRSVVKDMQMTDGVFWPIPVTVSVTKEDADAIAAGEDVTLFDAKGDTAMAIMTVNEKYSIDKELECKEVFKTTDPEHPGVAMVLAQKEVNLGGPIKVLSESFFPAEFPGIYQRPVEARAIFAERGWSSVAALQLRNPMHNSHAYLAKVAIEVTDGVYIHQLLGELKPGDIPADVRSNAIGTLIDKYFAPNTVIQAGYPLDMRYAGPREALLHALFRQNYGCSHQIVGRDHAGVGDYYGPFDAHHIFDEIPHEALETQPLKIDWTFWCYKCDGMASMKTCPHQAEDRLLLSGTKLRKALSEGEEVSDKFSRPEVLEILRAYYGSLKDDEKVEVKLSGHSAK